MEYLHGRAATPKSYLHQVGGDSREESNDKAYGKNGTLPQKDLSSPGPDKSSAGTSWLNTLPSLHPLIQWLQCMTVVLGAAYAFVKKGAGLPGIQPTAS